MKYLLIFSLHFYGFSQGKCAYWWGGPDYGEYAMFGGGGKDQVSKVCYRFFNENVELHQDQVSKICYEMLFVAFSK